MSGTYEMVCCCCVFQLAELTKAQQSENADMEEELNITQQVMELLPNAEENIEKLQVRRFSRYIYKYLCIT